MGSSEHPGALQYPGGSRASWGAQTLSPVGAPRSTPGPAEHLKLLGTPQTPRNTPDSWEHPSSSCVALRSSPSLLDPPGSSEQLGPLRDPQTPVSPWSPLEHPELSGAPRECLTWPNSHRQHPLPGWCPPFPLPQPPGRAGRCRKEFPKSPEFPKPLFFIKIKPDTSPLHSAVQRLLKTCDLQEKSLQGLPGLEKPIMVGSATTISSMGL